MLAENPEFYIEEETLAIYRDFKGVGKYQTGSPERIVAEIKPWYDGYCFAREKIGEESVFNSDMVFYHLKNLVAKGRPPENMVDVNILTDYDKLETIVDLQRQAGAQNVLPSVGELIDGVPFEICQSFDFERMARSELFPTVLQNEGILAPVRYSQGQVYYSFPNVAASLAYLYLMNGWNRVTDSYIIELKYSKPKDSAEQVAAKAEEGIAQLRRYAADRTVPALSAGTRLHCILYHFKGTELIRLEEIA